MHMAVARLGCKRTMVGTGWANSHPGCMSRLKKCYSRLSGGSFLARKVSWALSGSLTIESADYCMLVNEWARLRSQVCLLSLKGHFGSFLESELRQKNEDMVRYRHVYSEGLGKSLRRVSVS